MSEEEIWNAIEKDRESMGEMRERLARGAQTFEGINKTLERLEIFLKDESTRSRNQGECVVKLNERLKTTDGKVTEHVENHWKWATLVVAAAAVVVAIIQAIQ